MKKLYITIDNVAQDTIGVIMAEKADAAAVRHFVDALSNPKVLGSHPNDYDLWHIGYLDVTEDGRPQLTGVNPQQILTGAAWAASQQENVPVRRADSRDDAHGTVEARHLKEH